MGQFIPVIIGLLCLFLGKFLWEDWHVLSGNSQAVNAVVVEHASRSVHAGGGMSSRLGNQSGFLTNSYAAVYRFTDFDGSIHDVTDPVWSTNEAGVPAIGATASLRYVPGSPERAAPYTFARRFWAYAAVLAFIGGLTYAWLNPTLMG